MQDLMMVLWIFVLVVGVKREAWSVLHNDVEIIVDSDINVVMLESVCWDKKFYTILDA